MFGGANAQWGVSLRGARLLVRVVPCLSGRLELAACRPAKRNSKDWDVISHWKYISKWVLLVLFP